MHKQVQSPHRRGWLIYKEKFPQVVSLLALQLLLRAIAFSPLLYAVLSGSFFGMNPEHSPAFGFLFSLPLYVLLVMPFRFQAAARMAELHGTGEADSAAPGHYPLWLKAALWRLLRALPFLLPFFAFIFLFYWYMRVPGFNESLLAIETVGKLIGGDYPAGIALILLAGLVTAVLACIGWKRGLAFEHQRLTESGVLGAWKEGRSVSRRRRRHIRRTSLVNLLITLPALVGVLFVLGSHLLSLPRIGMLIMDFFNMVSVVLTLNFPASSVYQILIVLAVLWLPLLPWRKLALCAVLSQGRHGSAEA